MRLSTFKVATAFVLAMAFGQGVSAAAEPGAMVVNPKQNAKVERTAELLGKVLSPGQPIVLVRADQPGCHWWVQDHGEKLPHGLFKAKVLFGNDKSADGSRFRLVVLIAPTAEIAKQFEPGKSLKKLPADLSRSVDMKYILQREKDDPDVVAGVIHSPNAGSQVGRLGTVSGKVNEDTHPVILVRADENLWWVQAKVLPEADGSFTAQARFGNDTTPSGQRFHIVVIMPTAEQAEEYVPGMTLHKLPNGIPRSEEVHVIRQTQVAGG